MALEDYKVYVFGLMMKANTLNQTFSYFFQTTVHTFKYCDSAVNCIGMICGLFIRCSLLVAHSAFLCNVFWCLLVHFQGIQLIISWVANSSRGRPPSDLLLLVLPLLWAIWPIFMVPTCISPSMVWDTQLVESLLPACCFLYCIDSFYYIVWSGRVSGY